MTLLPESVLLRLTAPVIRLEIFLVLVLLRVGERHALVRIVDHDFARLHPEVRVTPDELEPWRSDGRLRLGMRASVNGTQYSDGNLGDMYWSFGQLMAYASRGTKLVPGDVIGSGTVGTGCILERSLMDGSERYPWLRADDIVGLEVDGLGKISARIKAGPEPVPLK